MSDRFPARRSRGGDLASPIAALLLIAALVAVAIGVLAEPGPPLLFLCCAAAIVATAGALLGIWGFAYRHLVYALTESALRVEWLGRTLVVPYESIHGIYAGQRLAGNATAAVPRWPGINVGPRRVRGMGKLRFFATSADQSELTLITVEQGGLVISAREPSEFQTALIERVEQSVEGDAVWHESEPNRAPWTAIGDRWLPICLGVGVVLLLLILAIIGFRYAELPDRIPLHFDVGGEPTQIGPKSDLLRLPLLALICVALNGGLGVMLHPRERVLARLLWLVALVVEAVLLIGLIRIIT